MSNVWIATIDPGKKNFAFIIQQVDIEQFHKIKFVPKDDRYNDDGTHTSEFKKNIEEICKCSQVIVWKKIDVTCGSKKYFDEKILYELTNILDSYKEYWDKCSYIIIEEQMSFGTKHNTMAIKIAQHCQSYFIFNYFKFKQIVMFPSYHKTKVLGALKGITKPQRKTWSTKFVNELIEHMELDNEIEEYKKEKKKDDKADCMLMVYAFLIKNFKK
jgi:hypothetical protein